MKKAILLSLLLTIPMISVPKSEATVSKNDLVTFVIASYNITHGKKNNWPKREPGVINVIKELDADILCVEEAITANDQIDSILKALPQYDFVGEPRSSGITKDVPFFSRIKYWIRMTGIPGTDLKAQDEYCPIFYNKNKFDLIETETFGINGDGSPYLPRICTRARLKPKNTEDLLDVYNTHLDNYEQKDRLMQSAIITNAINQRSKDVRVILAGDFNTELTDDIRAVLTANKFVHAKSIAKKVEGPNFTHEKGKGESKKLIECDHILVEPQNGFSVEFYKTSNTMSEETSDHNPVSMIFSLK